MTPKEGDSPSEGAPESPVFVEVHDENSGRVSTFGLVGTRQLIGRNQGLRIELPSERVSRLHAAFISDPYDRWWIHDLGSTNGTFVNGTRINQRLLNPGDSIQIGPYRLVLKVAAESNERATTIPPPRASEVPSTARERAASVSRLNSALTLDALECARTLLGIEDKRLRLKSLCEFTIAERFPGLWASVLRVPRTGKPTHVIRPLRRPTLSASTGHLEEQLEALGLERREVLLQSARPQVVRLNPNSAEYLVACVLDTDTESSEVLLVALADESDEVEWAGLLELLAASYRHADELWQRRAQFEANAQVEYELRMARQLQDSLMPRTPSLEGLDLAVGYEPSRWVGGDYVDAVRMPDGRVLLVVADVCGKGMQAALVASSLHTLINVLVESAESLSALVSRANEHLCRYLPEHSFVTMVCVAVDVEERELECINMGHPPPLLVSPDASVRSLQSGQNTALGMTAFAPRTARYELRPDEVLLLYTDGLSEPESSRPDPSGLTRSLDQCVQIIASASDGGVSGIHRRMAQVVNAQRSMLTASDDIAFLLARLSGRRRYAGTTSPGLTAKPPPLAAP